MKILLLSALISMTAVAGNITRSELLEIDAEYGQTIDGVVAINGNNVSILNACVTEDSIKTISPVTLCTKRELVPTGDTGSRSDRFMMGCTKYEQFDLSAPLVQEVNKCVRWSNIGGFDGQADRRRNAPCKKYAVVPVSAQTFFYPSVRETQGDDDEKWLGRRFDIPSCNEIL